MRLSAEGQEKIAFRNAEKLFRMGEQLDKKLDSYYSMNPHIIIAGQFTGYGI